MRLVRVDADREPRIRPKPLDPRGLLGFRHVAALEDHHHALEAGLFRARDDIIQILRERLVGEMAMTINHAAMVACRAPAALAALMCVSNLAIQNGIVPPRPRCPAWWRA